MGTAAEPDLQPRIKRHYRSAEERRHIVEQTLVPGTSVAIIARSHGVNANQVFAWRKMYQAGRLGGNTEVSVSETSASHLRLLPVTVAEDTGNKEPVPVVVSTQCDSHRGAVVASGSIDLTLANAQIRITGHVDAGILRVVLECLRG
jgi:transposase